MANIDRIPPYEGKDLKLLRSKPMFTNFGDERFRDHLELHIYSGENVLESNYNVDTYSTNTSVHFHSFCCLIDSHTCFDSYL